MLLIVSILILAILVSLGLALRHLVKDDQTSGAKMLKFLTFRIALSVALFVLLPLAWLLGWIEPHGLVPPG